MDALRAVPHALTWYHTLEAMLHTIQDGRADASTCGTADYNAGVHIDGSKVTCEVGPKES